MSTIILLAEVVEHLSLPEGDNAGVPEEISFLESAIPTVKSWNYCYPN